MPWFAEYSNQLTGDTRRTFSPFVFEGLPEALFKERPHFGTAVHEQFITPTLIESATDATDPSIRSDGNFYQGLKGANAGNTVAFTTGVGGTAAKLTTHTVANSEITFQLGGATSAPFSIGQAGSGVLGLEYRLRLTSAAAVGTGIFVGLAAANVGATAALIGAHNATTAVAVDKDLIGFLIHGGAAGALTIKAIYREEGGDIVGLATDLGTLVKDEWIKLGIRYEPKHKTVLWTVNSVVAHKSVDGADFPSAAMTPVFGVKALAGAAKSIEIDSWACRQSRLIEV